MAEEAPQKPAAQGFALVRWFEAALLTQKKPAGQGRHLRTRTRLLFESEARIVEELPSGDHCAEAGVLNSEPSPVGESANPAVPLLDPAIREVSPVRVDSKRTRWPPISVISRAPEE